MATESPHAASARTKFDECAEDYARLHRENVAVTGEQPVYFAACKQRCIERLVGTQFDGPVLDCGCGVGALHFSSDLVEVPDGHFGLLVMSEWLEPHLGAVPLGAQVMLAGRAAVD